MKALKTPLLVALLALAATGTSLAQHLYKVDDTLGVTFGDTAAKLPAYELDFAVPDIPAFKALNTDPTNILRPSSTRKIAIMASDLLINGNAIPKSFAAEFSPYLIAYDSAYVSKKEQASILWRTARVSIGTERAKNNISSKAAIGLRATLYDSEDTHNALVKVLEQEMQQVLGQVYNRLHADREEYEADKAALKARYGVNNIQLQSNDSLKQEVIDYTDWKRYLAYLGIDIDTYLLENAAAFNATDKHTFYKSDEIKRTVRDLVKQSKARAATDMVALEDEVYESFRVRLVSISKAIKDTTWNKNKLDVGVALLGTSADSLTQSLRAQSYNGWATWAQHFGKHGQLLIGAQYALAKDSLDHKFYNDLSLSSRYYIGTNRVKAYADAQVQYFDQRSYAPTAKSSALLVTGVEWNVRDGMWLNLYAGLQDDLTSSKDVFVSHFDLKFAIPEKWSLR